MNKQGLFASLVQQGKFITDGFVVNPFAATCLDNNHRAFDPSGVVNCSDPFLTRRASDKPGFLGWIVTARMPGMATQYPERTAPNTTNRPVLANGFYRISAAGWREAATLANPGAQKYLVQPDTADHQPGRDLNDMPSDR